MRAGLVTGQNTFTLVEFPDPVPSAGVAVVAVERCGICGTDVHGYMSERGYNPAICGHEWAGTVTDVGHSVTNVREGDRVVCGIAPACGDCEPCRNGQSEWCMPSFMGMIGRDALAPRHGGFASHIAVDARRLVPFSAPLSVEEAAMIEPTAVCLHAVRRTPTLAGRSVAVLGAGPIGLLTLQCVLAMDAGLVTVIEPNPERAALAGVLGAHVVVGPDSASGLVVDVAFECVGLGATIQVAVDLVRRGGHVTLVGMPNEAATINPAAWMLKELTLATSLGYVHADFGDSIDLVSSGRVRLDPLHSRTVGLDAAAQVFADLAVGGTGDVKVLIDPNA